MVQHLPTYCKRLRIPANTSEENYVEVQVEVEGDILKKVVVLIPDGHHALAHFRLRYGIKNIVPYEEDQWLEGNNEQVTFEPNWELPEHPCLLRLQGYNEDDTYEHSFYVRIETDYEEYVRPFEILRDFVKIFKKLLGIR